MPIVLNVSGSDDVCMELPITKDILQLTSYVCDVLSQPGKNLLLCGLNGSGRKESLHIGCTFLQIKIFSPIPVKNYKIEDFYNDLRTVGPCSVSFNRSSETTCPTSITKGNAIIRSGRSDNGFPH